MISDEDKILLEGIKTLLAPELEHLITFNIDTKQKAPIKISFRGKQLPEESLPFSETFRRLTNDFLKPKDQFTSRILQDLGTNKKTKSKSGKTLSIVYIFNSNIQYIDTNFSDIAKIESKAVRDLSEEEAVRLLEEVYNTWRVIPASHRTPRKINDKIVRGYFKQRENYTHREIIKGITVYGQWAYAYQLALDAGENENIFWFHPWRFDQFLLSNKAMSHVDSGWKTLVREKKIPSEYVNGSDLELDQDLFERNVLYFAKEMIEWGELGIESMNTIRQKPELKQKYMDAIDAKVKELKDAA